ncbi:MAG TPA: ABC transporter ATP-binding protein [Kiritimatiellia bacterium]|nr:ABC transporter ATP-binding protein [Kiritimatiellia bacterium]HMP35190.1 ABC transporter ATP-binding protein [Kiritimatiellia bacterium]
MNDSSPALVEVQHLSKVFRDFWRRPKVQAVDDVSFSIRRGEVFGLLGPNGSGKSTTIKMLLGLLFPTRGTIQVLGRSPRDVQNKRRIGYLPEESYLYSYLTSWETLDFYGRLFDLGPAERRARIDQLLDMIGLRHARNRVVGEFSKGMARRIGLAQALINDPDFIILDEPTSGLDPIGCRQIKDLILTLARRGKTILMTSHLLADVEDVCDRVAILYNGRVQAQGTIDELLQEAERFRLTLPHGVTRAQAEHLAAEAARLTGIPPELDHPRRDLEQFFLQVVEKARAAASSSSGVGSDQGVATYLRPAETTASNPSTPPTAPPPEDVDKALASLVRRDPPE